MTIDEREIEMADSLKRFADDVGRLLHVSVGFTPAVPGGQHCITIGPADFFFNVDGAYDGGCEADTVVEKARAALGVPDRTDEQHEAGRVAMGPPSTQESADETKFPGGLVPTALPAKRMGGRVRTRRR